MPPDGTYPTTSRHMRMMAQRGRSVSDVVATEMVPAMANAAARGEIAVRRALDATSDQRAAVARIAREEPFLVVAVASFVGLLLVSRLAERRRRAKRARIARVA